MKLLAETELCQLPLDHVCRHAEVTKGADRHVAADTGKTIEKEGAHGDDGLLRSPKWHIAFSRAILRSDYCSF